MPKFPSVLWLAAVLASLTGCGGGELPVTTTPPVTATGTAAVLSLTASPASVQTDNLPTTVTVQALTATNAVVPSAVVTLSTDTGQLGSSTVVTGSDGKATFTFSSGLSNKANRTATITASAGATAQLPVQITGSSLTVSSTGTNIPDDGTSPVTVTFTALDADNSPISSAAISVTASGTGTVTLTPASGTTDASGNFSVSVAGTAAGTVTVTGSAVGATAAVGITVSSTAATFGISQTQNGATIVTNPTAVSMRTGDSLTVTVSAPASTTVRFFTTQGTWTVSGTSSQDVVVGAGTASAILTTTFAGVANVQVTDPNDSSLSDTLTVSMTAVTPNKITLQASPSVVPKRVGTTTGTSTLIATVTDASGQPVGDVPVGFSIIDPTGGGESVSPAVVYTASTASSSLGLGEARTSFTSGSKSSPQSGVHIRAQVLGTAVETNTAPSGNDAAIVIGGTAGSVAFGSATTLSTNSNGTAYILAMSVLVADSNGNPAPAGTVVNLSVWPIAWSTGSGCAYDADGAAVGTFYNEDINENVILDTGEDGTRRFYDDSALAASGVANAGQLVPPNSAAGTLPATVTTDANGLATFNLTYSKNSAIWIVDRIRARTVVQGTEAVGEITFRLAPTKADADPPSVCLLPPSPYYF